MNKRVLASQPLLCNCWLCHIMISKDNCSWPLKLLQNFNKWNSLTYWFLYGLYILCTDITFINSNSLFMIKQYISPVILSQDITKL